MRIDRRLFRSRLAHRVFLAFLLCAVVPIGLVGVLSFRSVTNQLVTQASSRLRQASKTFGLSLYERLLFAEAELDSVTAEILLDPNIDIGAIRGQRLSRFTVLDPGAEDRRKGTGESTRAFQLDQKEGHLAEGHSVLLALPRTDGSNPIRLAARLHPLDPTSEFVVGELDPTYLWGLEAGNSIPADAEFCVFESSGRLIFGSFDGCDEAWDAVGEHEQASGEEDPGTLFSAGLAADEVFVVGYRELFLAARFFAPDWLIVVCQPRSVVVKPIERWRLLFPAVVLLALWVVLLLIIAAIRKNLDPIDRLREGAARLADGDLEHQVVIRSGDEFEELADAFNGMSKQLRRQFGSLAATGEIHRAILSSFETGQVVEATVRGIVDYFECDRAAVIILPRDDRPVRRESAARGDARIVRVEDVIIHPGLRGALDRVPPGVVIGHDLPAMPELSSVLEMGDLATVLAVPIFNRGAAAAIIGLGYEQSRSLPEDDLEHLSLIADQFAVALSNARMLQDVNDFSLGTLEALARAVDAKSPWTAGHSERVTQLAVAIGLAMELDPYELSRLHRGAMLHDIGKIGISQTILDKKGRLEREEFEVVKSHTAIGERILEPIGAFAEILPVIGLHHERFDGSGYPNGLAGAAIDVKARILAVADVYDAMTNHRPYRESVAPHEVVEMIQNQSGSQFDPTVVEAFLRVIDARGGIEHLVLLEKDFSMFTQVATDRDWNHRVRREGRNS